MNRSDVEELYYITHIDNMPSIMQYGILSRNYAFKKGIDFQDISEEGVQDRRLGKKVLGTNRELHDYANLYFDAHNPMLSARRSRNNEICVLRIRHNVIDMQDVIVTDKNAARDCWFKPVSDGLPLLDKERIYAVMWIYRNPPDPIEEYKHAGEKCAEVLVPCKIDAQYIVGAYVANNNALQQYQAKTDLTVTINRGLFF